MPNARAYLIAAALGAAFLLVLTGLSRGQEYPNCEGWINKVCCCTNNCCFEVAPGTVTHLGGDDYRVIETGQIVKRTGWSQNGRFMRCACDYDSATAQWVKHDKAHTRCIYPPMPNS